MQVINDIVIHLHLNYKIRVITMQVIKGINLCYNDASYKRYSYKFGLEL